MVWWAVPRWEKRTSRVRTWSRRGAVQGKMMTTPVRAKKMKQDKTT